MKVNAWETIWFEFMVFRTENCVNCFVSWNQTVSVIILETKEVEHIFVNWIMSLTITQETKTTWLKIKVTFTLGPRQVKFVSSLVDLNCLPLMHLFNKHLGISYCLATYITNREMFPSNKFQILLSSQYH